MDKPTIATEGHPFQRYSDDELYHEIGKAQRAILNMVTDLSKLQVHFQELQAEAADRNAF